MRYSYIYIYIYIEFLSFSLQLFCAQRWRSLDMYIFSVHFILCKYIYIYIYIYPSLLYYYIYPSLLYPKVGPMYPTCSGSGCDAKPERPHIGEYMCEKCLYPPCASCGRKRPRQSNSQSNSVHVKAVWRCGECCRSSTKPEP